MQVFKEKVLATKGEWTIVARLVEFTTKETGKVRRTEIVFFSDPNYKTSNDLKTGWTAQELAVVHNKLVEWTKEIGESI